MTRAWDKEIHLGSRQESNPWPPKNPAGALSTELRELVESEAITRVLQAASTELRELVESEAIWLSFTDTRPAGCILLESAMPMPSWIVVNESGGEFLAR